MELEQLKNLWKEDNVKLQKQIEINRDVLKSMKLQPAISDFKLLMLFSKLGRNLALVYALISFTWSALIIEDYIYSVPLIIGGILMVWSFIHHLKIKEPNDYANTPILELQKAICKFRIHTFSSMKYDFAVVVFWGVTISPIYLKTFFHFPIYDNLVDFGIFTLVFGLSTIIFIVFTIGLNRTYKNKLDQSESCLQEIIEFDKM